MMIQLGKPSPLVKKLYRTALEREKEVQVSIDHIDKKIECIMYDVLKHTLKVNIFIIKTYEAIYGKK